MAHQSEAACLLQTGAQYPRRLGLRSGSGVAFAGFKHGAFSLYFDDEPIYHFDLEGRWQRAFVAGVHFLKALDATVDAIERPRQGANMILCRRRLGFAEAADLDASIRAVALDLIDALAPGPLESIEPPPARPIAVEDLRDGLERIAGWDAAAWFAHRERYLATYGPIPFLPPDAQNAVILQATLGHADGLAFGGGPAAEHYVRDAMEFDEHARAVAALLGRRVEQCRGIFLGGSDVLRRPIADVETYLRVTAQVFPIDPDARHRRTRDVPGLAGVQAFFDRFESPRPDPASWRLLRLSHLRRVNLGVESGDREVRALYSKTWDNDALRATVADLKDAGIEVGVMTMVGAGGSEQAERHVAATADLINALPLGPGDLVCLLDANEVGGDQARDRLRGRGLTPLIGQAWQDQQGMLRDRLAATRYQRGAKVIPYSL